MQVSTGEGSCYCEGSFSEMVETQSIIGRAKRAPHWGVQSRFRVIYTGI